MALLDKIKSGARSLVQDENNVIGKIADKVTAFRQKKIVEPVQKFLGETPELKKQRIEEKKTELIAKGVEPQKAELRTAVEEGINMFDPFMGVGSIERVGAKPAKSLISKMAKRLGVPEETRKVVSFLEEQGKYLSKESSERVNVINKNIDNPNLIVKVRPKGNRTIKITKGELDTLKSIGDLKPKVLNRTFQNPIRVFEELGEEAKELLYRPIKTARGMSIQEKDFAQKLFKAKTKGLNQKSSKNIMKYALSKEEDGKKILASMKESVPELTEKEKEAYNFMRYRYNQFLDRLNEARASVGKTPIRRRDNYFTHIKDMGVLEQMGFNPATDDIEALLAGKIHRNTTAFRFAKSRKGLDVVELDAFNVFNKYQESAIDHINLTPAIGKLRELTRTGIFDPSTGEKFLLQDKAPNLYKYTQEMLDFVAGQKPPTIIPKAIESAMNKLNKNVAFSTLSGNIRSAFIQPAAITNTITEIGVKDTTRGIKELMLGGGKFALDNSNVLKGRQFETAIKDIADGIAGKSGRAKQKIGELGLKPLQILDSITAQATWLGAFNRAKTKLGYVTEKAINYADDVVTKTQASAAAEDIAPIQRTTGGKLATLFQTFVINDFNRVFRDVLGVGGKLSTKEKVRKTATMAVAITLWNYLFEDVLGLPTPFPRPVKEFKERGAMEAGKELLGQVPIIGGAARFGGSVGGAVFQLVQGAFNKVSGKYTPESWWEIAGKLVGVPGVSQLKKTIKSVKGLEDGYTVTTNDGKRIKISIDDPIDKARALLFGLYQTKAAKETRETGKRPK